MLAHPSAAVAHTACEEACGLLARIEWTISR
jgi:hypothetical protein